MNNPFIEHQRRQSIISVRQQHFNEAHRQFDQLNGLNPPRPSTSPPQPTKRANGKLLALCIILGFISALIATFKPYIN